MLQGHRTSRGRPAHARRAASVCIRARQRADRQQRQARQARGCTWQCSRCRALPADLRSPDERMQIRQLALCKPLSAVWPRVVTHATQHSELGVML